MINAIQTIEQNTVRSQIIPLEGMHIVLPNTCIAEIINYNPPETIKKSPDWLLGLIDWRGIRIPVISFEAMNSITPGKQQKSSRIIIINGIGDDSKMCFYGILTQGIPRLITIAENQIAIIKKPARKLPLSIQQTMVNDQTAVIPDQDIIEQKLKQQGLIVKI